MTDRHIRRGQDEYAGALAALLPTGLAWPREQDSKPMQVVRGLAGIFGYVDSRAADLLEQESDPRITLEMLPDWERNWGLPDECFPNGGDIDQRHLTLMLKMTIEGAQSRAFFVNIAKQMGYPIKIFEFAPFMCGVSRCGDTQGDDARPRWQIGPPEMRFYWTVHPIAEALHWFRAGVSQSGVDSHLRFETAGDLECIFKRWKPAHTMIVFDYSGVDNSDYYANLYKAEISFGQQRIKALTYRGDFYGEEYFGNRYFGASFFGLKK